MKAVVLMKENDIGKVLSHFWEIAEGTSFYEYLITNMNRILLVL